MSITRATLFDWAFGQRKQSDALTAISAASLNKSLPYRNFSPARVEKVWSSDRAWFGKGHDFATQVRKMREQVMFAREFEATSESLAWALSLLMGDVTTTGPVTNIYTHELVWTDSCSQRECLYTTIIEKAGCEYQNLINGVVISDVTLTGVGSEFITLAVNCTGRQQVTNATTLPDTTPSVFFRTNHATFTFGATGAQAAVSEQVLSWGLTLSQNPEYRWMPGQSSGDESYFRYALIGNQSVSGNIKVFLDTATRAKFLNDTECGLTITCKSTKDVNQQLIIEIPKFIINAEEISQDGQTTGLQLNFNEDSVMKSDSVDGSPIRITLKNEISALLV